MADNQEELYYVLDVSSGAVGNSALWWAKDSKGYTCDLSKAGLYAADGSWRPTDVLVPRDLAESMVERHVDLDKLRRCMVLPYRDGTMPVRTGRGV